MRKAKNCYSERICKPLSVPDRNIYQFLTHRNPIHASKTVCVCHEETLSFHQLKSESSRYAKALVALGVQKGDIVPICSEPTIASILFFFALNRIGAICCFLNSTANDEEISSYLQKFAAKTFVISCRCYSQLHRHGAWLEHIDHVICIPSLATRFQQQKISSKTHVLCLADFLTLGRTVDTALDSGGKKDAALISFTSGTTGTPKSILLSNENLMAEFIALKKATLMQWGPRANAMQVVPFNYPYGFIVSVLFPMYCGKTVALTPEMTLQNIGRYLERYRPGYINGIPAFYLQLMRDTAENRDLSFIQFPVTGGDTLDTSTEEKINSFLRAHGSRGRIMNGCGNAEGCGSLLNPASVIQRYRTGSCGKAIPGLSVKLISDETGEPVPIGKTGRFCFSGTNLMMEYYHDPAATNHVIRTDQAAKRWFYSDAYMHMDADGWMYMDGRDRRFFITFDSSGSPYKVYCDYVQATINAASDQISGCAVVKKADCVRSFVPIAYIQFHGSQQQWNTVLQKIQTVCMEKLQRCAVPAEYIRIDQLPLTVAGKMDYDALEKLTR
jgi:long-chain acyl-CoA synthetase